MSRPCTCEKSKRGEPWIEGKGCRLCWLYWNDYAYFLHWSGKAQLPLDSEARITELANWYAAPPEQQIRPGVFVRAANFIGATARHVCTGMKQVSPAELKARLRVCATCNHYNPAANSCNLCGCGLVVKASWADTNCPIDKWQTPRHLIYHVYPRNRALWHWHMDELRAKLGMFTGRKLLTVNVDDTTDRAADVREYLASPGVEFIERPNDPLGETGAFFDHLLPALQFERGVTFYGHAKGTSHHVAQLSWVIPWSKRMYDYDLSEQAVAALKTAPCAGIFKNRRPFSVGFTDCPWHYPGTFFWFRNDCVFAHPTFAWRQHDPHRYAVEMFVGYRFGVDEGACLYGEGQPTF